MKPWLTAAGKDYEIVSGLASNLEGRRCRGKIFRRAVRRRVYHDMRPSAVIAYITNDVWPSDERSDSAAVSRGRRPAAMYERNLSAGVKFLQRYSRLVVSGWTRRAGRPTGVGQLLDTVVLGTWPVLCVVSVES